MATKAKPTVKPTATVGGAPASYKPVTPQPTVTIGGAPAGYVDKPVPAKVMTPGEKAVANPTIANINAFIDSLKSNLADMNVAAGLNPDGTQKVEKPLTRIELNAQNEAAGPPGPAPAGFVYRFISSNTGGSWKLYSTGTTVKTGGGTGGGTGTGGTGTDNTTDTTSKTPSTSLDVLKALLKAEGLSSKIIDSSASYLNSLLKDNLDYDNAIEVFLNTKDYTLKNGTQITSPFYTEYGYLNEGLPKPKTAAEIFNAVEGYKELKTKYGFSDKYLSTESLKGYVKNNVSVADLDERANAARLAGITADPNKTAALIQLGYIKDSTGLQDFFMDSTLGKQQLESNRNTGAFVAEAIRRAGKGVQTGETQLTDFKKIAAEMTAKGYTEAQIAQLASTGFENIAQAIKPLTTYAGIYDKAGGTTEANQALSDSLQKELLAEEFSGTASERRKRLLEQNTKAFQGTAGLTSGSLKTTGMI